MKWRKSKCMSCGNKVTVSMLVDGLCSSCLWERVEPMLPDCIDMIKDQYRTLDDLPRDLANFVATICYRILNYSKYIFGGPEPLSQVSKKFGGDFVATTKTVVTQMTLIQIAQEHLPAMINDIRRERATGGPWEMFVLYILANLKYRIDTGKHSYRVTEILMKFRKPVLQDIPGLIDRLGNLDIEVWSHSPTPEKGTS